jgi:uncharacterized membrane protein YqjE
MEERQTDLRQTDLKEQAGRVLRSGSALIATRAALFREELSAKGGFLGRALALLALALGFGLLALFLLTALVAAVLTKLLGTAVAGILATLVLYLAAGGAALLVGRRLFASVRPFDFPLTTQELRRDFEALCPAEERKAGPTASAPPPSARPAEDLEQLFRAGSE